MRLFPTIPLRVILLAVLGSLLVIAGAIAAVIALWQPSPLEAIMPAESTVALFSNVTREDLRQWSDRFRILQTVPMFEGPTEIAIVKLASGSEAWIATALSKDAPLPGANADYKGQKLLLSSGEALAVTTDETPRLRSSQTFAALMRGMDRSTPRVYLHDSPANAKALLPSPLLSFVEPGGDVLLTKEKGTLRVRIAGTTTNVSGAFSLSTTSLDPAPDHSITIAAPADTLETALGGLSEIESAVLRGRIGAAVNATLGGEWSLEYDVLPLLGPSSTIAWRTGTGGIRFLIDGTADARDPRTRLGTVHENFKTRLAAATVTKRSLDQGFASAILGSDPSAIVDRTATANGWTMRDTREENGDRALMSATNGRSFLLSNDDGWMEQAMARPTRRPIPTLRGSPVAGGVLSPAALKGLAAGRTHSQAWLWLLADKDMTRETLWGLDIDGDALTLTME